MSELPPEVIEASRRLDEVKRPTNVPYIFREIIANDAERMSIMAKGENVTQAEWRRLKVLSDDKKKHLRPAAEKALVWNTDKGNTA